MHEFDSHHRSPLTLFILRAELLEPISFVEGIHHKIYVKDREENVQYSEKESII